MINQQSAARSMSSKYETTQSYLSVSCQHDRLHLTGKRPQQWSQELQKQYSSPPILFLQKVISAKNNTKHVRYDTGRMHATLWFFPWIL